MIRVDLAEKILRAAFEARSKVAGRDRNAKFRLDLSLAISIGLEDENARRLLGSAGFRVQRARALAEGAQGPIAPDGWSWRPRRPGEKPRRPQKERRGDRHNAKGGDQRKRPKPDGRKRGRNERPRHAAKPADAGPARAGGAFDKLADLLRG